MQEEKASPQSLPDGRPAHAGTFSIWPGWLLLMHDAGVDGANVLRRAQLPGDLFARPSTRLDSQTYFKLWAAIEADGRPEDGPVPLRLAERMTSDWFEPELFVALCSDDMNGALTRLAKYKRLAGPMALHIERTGRRTTAALEFLDHAMPPPSVLMAFKLVFLVQLARLATRSKLYPLQVGWPQPPQSAQEARAYADYFGVSVEDAPVPTLVFSAEDAKQPFLTANHGMWSFFEPALRQRLADLNRHATTADRVRSALLEALPAGGLSMQAVCRKLGVSSRTLQRRLQEEGTSFQQTLDNLRNALAHHYLQNSLMSGAEIAFLLGFEDPNSFIRSFQAWNGSTPHAVRLAQAAAKGNSAEPELLSR
ncbi:AraC family transcriptional regulator ligand-binding domain-containing protein [Acidovorax sp. NPDC077693]|uniref:AraC family transcriptional regulator n=1 Tax=unclassified Acidovorax TaxID=2684926 RepID=UPI0037C980CF